MRTCVTIVGLCLLLALPVCAQQGRGLEEIVVRLPGSGKEIQLYKRSHAVVIGVSDYEFWPDLPNAARDAEEVAEGLRGMGFSVRLVLNPDSYVRNPSHSLPLCSLSHRLPPMSEAAIWCMYRTMGSTSTSMR